MAVSFWVGFLNWEWVFKSFFSGKVKRFVAGSKRAALWVRYEWIYIWMNKIDTRESVRNVLLSDYRLYWLFVPSLSEFINVFRETVPDLHNRSQSAIFLSCLLSIYRTFFCWPSWNGYSSKHDRLQFVVFQLWNTLITCYIEHVCTCIWRISRTLILNMRHLLGIMMSPYCQLL